MSTRDSQQPEAGPSSAPASAPASAPSPADRSLPYPDRPLDWQAIAAVPEIHETAWVAQGAAVLGRVRLLQHASVWYGCTLRGDGDWIVVGPESNVQDGSVLHADPGYPCTLGRGVTVGHRAIVHASCVEDYAMIAMGATVLTGCTIGSGSLIAAGAVLLEGTTVPPGTVWAGCPARQIREVDAELAERIAHAYQHYVNTAAACLTHFGRAHIAALQSQPIADPRFAAE